MKRLKISFVPSWNFGDALNTYLLYKNGVPFHYTHHHVKNKIIMIGSILSNYQSDDTTVLGAGTIKSTERITKKMQFRAIRGPKTLEMLNQSGIEIQSPVFGDPALLLPNVYNRPVEKKFRLGIIPHQVDFNFVREKMNADKSSFSNTLLIDPTAIKCFGIERYIDNVNSCDVILSTSLHGIIAAHAYGVPAYWMKVSDKLIGDNVKFYDYFASIGHTIDGPMDMITNDSVHVDAFHLNLDLAALNNVMPWVMPLDDTFYVDDEDENWIKSCYPEKYDGKLHQDYWKMFNG